MKNKILINIYVPSLNEEYELFVSINESINKNLELIVKIIEEYSDSNFNVTGDHFLINPNTCTIYNDSLILRDTDIRNGAMVLLI